MARYKRGEPTGEDLDFLYELADIIAAFAGAPMETAKDVAKMLAAAAIAEGWLDYAELIASAFKLGPLDLKRWVVSDTELLQEQTQCT